MRSIPVTRSRLVVTALWIAAVAATPMPDTRPAVATGQAPQPEPAIANDSDHKAANETFTFHHENVLGTSMELAVATTDRKAAQACEKAVLNEIERLSRILSTYDPASEINKLNASASSVRVSRELGEVLTSAQVWQERSGGAFNIQVGAMTALWRQAEKTGRPPASQQLAAIARQIEKPGFEIDLGSSRARRVGKSAVTVDALAKGYIIERAATAGRQASPRVAGILLDIGGDLGAWGSSSVSEDTPWTVGVADPRHRQDNSPPMTRVGLRNQAIATSGPYARGFNVGKSRHSHILDPRTGQPADAVISATVVASDAMTADALATCLNVLAPADGLKLLADVRGAEGLIVAADGRQYRSSGWMALEIATPTASQPATLPTAGSARKELVIDLQLLRPARGAYARPYVAIWIEDSAGKPVATVAVWGHERQYQRSLTTWWKSARQNTRLIDSISRATRPAGKYSLTWRLTDDQGKPLPPGTYTVCVEVNRERGRHVLMRGSIGCQDKQASATIKGNSEVADIILTYGGSVEEK